jgi:DeoR/GlpR family transcriptional regulator of sugar metabolism
VFGGAIQEKQNWNESPFELRETLHSHEKDKIARCTADLIVNSDTLLLMVVQRQSLLLPTSHLRKT